MGGKTIKAPDYSGMESVAREQLRFSQQQYRDMMPIARDVAESQIEAQRQQMQQAQDYYDYQMNTFRPLEEQLVAEAANFNTDAFRQQKAAEASAAAAKAFGIARDSTARSNAARGINPNSGAARGGDNALVLQEAAMRAQGMTGARQQAEQMGYARRLDATGLGRGLAGASAAAYGGAVGAGSAGMGTFMAPGQAYQQGLAGAGQTYGQLTSNQGQLYSATRGQNMEMLGAGLGFAGGFFSDRRLKKDIQHVGFDEKTQLPLYQFRYRDDPKNRLFVGVMSDDAGDYMPSAVVLGPDGYERVDYEKLGIPLVEVRA